MDAIAKELFGLPNCSLSSSEQLYEKSADRDYKSYKKFRLIYSDSCPDTCPECGGKLYAHGKRTIRIMDTPMGGLPVILELEYPRRRCRDCRYMWKPTFEGVDEDRLMTERAFRDIAQKSLRNTFEDVCNDYMLTANTAKNVFVQFIETYKEQLRFATPAFLGIDEIKIKKIGEVTVITDLEHHTLYDMLLGRNQRSLTEYFSQLPNAKDVIWVCSDMYRPFERSISFALPNASWAIDHFHVVMKANEAVDDVRRKLQSDMPKRERIKTKRGFAYTLKKRMDDLTEEEAEKIKLARRSEKTAPFAVAYDLKEDFFNIYDNNPSSKESAQQAFAEWEASIPQDELYDKFRDLAKTVHNFYDQIFAYWDCPIAISNGFTECTNRLIRENNCRGRGYSFEVLKARTLFRRKNLALMFQNDLVTQNFGPSIPENEPVFHFEGSKNDTSYDDDDEDDDYEPFPEEDDIGVEEPED